MKIINQIQLYVILAFVILLFIVVAGVILYVLARKKAQTQSVHVDYSNFYKKDIMDFMKFDDLISAGEPMQNSEVHTDDEWLKGRGTLTRNNGNTFVGTLNVTGWNFYDASFDEQVQCINATISMFGALETPVTLRQSSRAIDITTNIEEHEQIRMRIQEKIGSLADQLEVAIIGAEDNIDEPDTYNLYMENIHKLTSTIEVQKHLLEEAEAVITYMKNTSINSNDTQPTHQFIYSYEYNPTQRVAQLSKEEIYQLAEREVDNMGAMFGSALVRAGCSARRASAADITDSLRRHSHPITADEGSIYDLFDTEVNRLFVTSDSLEDYVKAQMAEETYLYELEEFKKNQQIQERRQTVQFEKAEADRIALIRQYEAEGE